ncbi:MAG: hypothetical protein ACK5DE_11195 [Bacteroidota bacterium]|jgi:hypothetical protein
MDKNLQDYYEEAFSMFSLQGWKDLVDDMKALQSEVTKIENIKDEKDLWFRRGQLDILDLIVNRKQMCEKVYEELQNEKNI